MARASHTTKSFVLAIVPHQRFALGRMSQRGQTTEVHTTPTFATEREAVHAVFLERLRDNHLWDGATTS